MTLVVALACADGLVLAADSAASFSEGVQQSTAKIRQLGKWAIWGSAGHEGMGQEFEARIRQLVDFDQDPPTLVDLRIALQLAMYETASRWLTHTVRANAPAYLSTPVCHALIVARVEDDYRIIEVEPNGNTGVLTHYRYAAIGSGALWAKAALYPIRGRILTVEQAKPVLWKVLQEAIEGHASGLAQPVQMWAMQVASGDQGMVRPNIQDDDGEVGRMEYGAAALSQSFDEALDAIGAHPEAQPEN